MYLKNYLISYTLYFAILIFKLVLNVVCGNYMHTNVDRKYIISRHAYM